MKIKTFMLKALLYIRNILLVDIVIGMIVAISFIFTSQFNYVAYSERMFWVGLGVTLLAGLVAFGALFAGRSFGIPLIIRKPEEARKLLDNMGQYRAEVDKRNDISFQLFIIGLG